MKERAILYDSYRCIGCRACQSACQQWNQLPAEPAVTDDEISRTHGYRQSNSILSKYVWLSISVIHDDSRWSFSRHACLHCNDAACLTVCPVQAIKRTDHGFIVIDKNICIGCRLCEYHCPYRVPQFDDQTQTVWKCWMCQDRLVAGLEPACVGTCPTKALEFGIRGELATIAKQRMSRLGSGAFLYGLTEFGGLHVLYISDTELKDHGFPETAKLSSATWFWRQTVRPFGTVALSVSVLGIAASIIAGWSRKNSKDVAEQDE